MKHYHIIRPRINPYARGYRLQYPKRYDNLDEVRAAINDFDISSILHDDFGPPEIIECEFSLCQEE